MSKVAPPAPIYDPDAQLFFNAETGAGVTLTVTQMNAVNQLVLDLKAASIWTKMKALYPVVGGTATAHKFNLKNPLDTNAAFRLIFSGGWTHSATGMLPNGINGYANTFLVPSVVTTLNNIHISYYSRSNTPQVNDLPIGVCDGFGINYTLIAIRTTYSLLQQTNIANYPQYPADPNALGFYESSRTGANLTKLYKGGLVVGTGLGASTGQPSTRGFYLGATQINILYPSNKECAFASIGDGLTDLESQLFYQITEKYQVALGRNINALQSFYYNSAYNNETNAFLFSTQITDNTIQTATNTLVSDLKTANIFTKMKAIYPMVGGTATTCKFNLANAQDTNEAFRLVFSGGFTFSSTGVLPNGINANASTFLIPATSLSANSSHLSIYNRTGVSGTINDMGTSGGGLAFAIAASFSNTAYLDCTNSTTNRIATPNLSPIGFFVGTRASSTSLKIFKNGTQLGATNANASVGVAGLGVDVKLFSYNPVQNLSNRECAFASIGDGLNDVESLAYYTAVQNFQTSLSRQV